jgi:hypothetical protein
MEPEGSLPCSQEPSTDPYPEPDGSSPYLISILISSTHLRPGFPSGLYPSGFPTNPLYGFLFSPFVLHALLKLKNKPLCIDYVSYSALS